MFCPRKIYTKNSFWFQFIQLETDDKLESSVIRFIVPNPELMLLPLGLLLVNNISEAVVINF
jgi:hypothetical protein